MTKIIVNSIEPQVGVTSVTFIKSITANGEKQWLDEHGVIKANRDTIAENVTIPEGTNGLSSGPVTIADGYEITVRGDWAIV